MKPSPAILRRIAGELRDTERLAETIASRHRLARPGLTESFVAPRTATEDLIAGIWAEVLRIDRVGVNDSFFTLGGSSVLATQILSRVHEVFRVDISLPGFFAAPTVAGLADSVAAAAPGQAATDMPPLIALPRGKDIPLSFAQQRLWFLHQLEPASAAYNMPLAVRLQGRLDVPALMASLSEIARRHEILRTTFPRPAGEPVQSIRPWEPVRLPVVDLRAVPLQQRRAETERLVRQESILPFDLAGSPPWRGAVLASGEEEHVVLLTMHHIVSDGWSQQVLVGELAVLYEAFAQRRPSPLRELGLQYADFAHWQRRELSGARLEAELAYWRERLQGMPTELALPTDRPRSAWKAPLSASLPVAFPPELSAPLAALAQREGATLFMALLAGFQAMLSHHSGQHDIVVGTNVANRTRLETEGLIGFFVNQLVLRTILSGDPTFREILRRVREVAMGAYAHQDLPYERLVQELKPGRQTRRSLLFQVKLEMLNLPAATAAVAVDLRFEPLAIEKMTRYDLHLSMWETARGLRGELLYDAELFDEATVSRLMADLERLLEQVTDRPEMRLSEVSSHLAELDRQRRQARRKTLAERNVMELRKTQRRAVTVPRQPQGGGDEVFEVPGHHE